MNVAHSTSAFLPPKGGYWTAG